MIRAGNNHAYINGTVNEILFDDLYGIIITIKESFMAKQFAESDIDKSIKYIVQSGLDEWDKEKKL